jgi:hypothetical protein
MSSEPLTAYVITWEARRSDGTVYSGARRVFADSIENARESAQRQLAEDLGLPAHAIEILDVRRM